MPVGAGRVLRRLTRNILGNGVVGLRTRVWLDSIVGRYYLFRLLAPCSRGPGRSAWRTWQGRRSLSAGAATTC